MQNASVNYADAATGAGGVWAEPQLRADWLGDGFTTGGDGQAMIVADDFARVSFDDWDTTPTGHLWLEALGTQANFDVDGTAGIHSVPAANTAMHSIISGVSMRVVDQVTELTCPAPTGAGIEAGVLFCRYIDASNHYRLGALINTDATVTALIVRAVGGVETTIASVTVPGLAFDASASLLVRGRITGGNLLRLRIWQSQQAEPLDWHAEVTDSTAALAAAGGVGLRSQVRTSNTNTKPVVFRFLDYRAVNGTVDDLTGQTGGWSVDHFLDDGYPDAVTFISGVGTPELSADLGVPAAYATNWPMQVAEFFSPYNQFSPMFGLDRDVAALQLDHGVITTSGPERIRVFTGQMADIPVRRGRANLSAVSATRLALAKAVQPPTVNGVYQGANATWPVSFALAACGVYASPPPQTDCRWWAPMHGSCRSFLPADNREITDLIVYVDGQLGPNRTTRIRTCEGPYVAAMENGCNPGFFQRTLLSPAGSGLHLEDGPNLVSRDSVGKFEAWVRGDDFNLNFAAGGSGTISSLHRMLISNNNGTSADGLIRIDNRKLQMSISDGVNSASVTSTNGVPSDGAWHFVGFAWDVANKKVWVNLDGSVQSATNASLVPNNFPVDDDFADDRPIPFLTMPVAEVQLTAGVTGSPVSPDVGPWLRDIAFTARAVVSLSVLELANVADPAPMEAWAYIARYAQAELASMRTDELDVFTYLTCGWWVKAAQQVVAETYSTEFNADTVDINIDPSKIRTQVVVSFTEALSINAFTTAFSTVEPISVPPGLSTLTVPLSLAAFEIRGFSFTNIVAATTVQPINVNSVSFNAARDGSGAYYASTSVSVTITAWTAGQVELLFNNTSGVTVYTANDKNWPPLTIAAKAQDDGSATVTESDATSVAVRGERSISVTNDVLQTRVNARRLARRLLMGLRRPQPAAEALTLFGEARRQPGDLVAFEDPSITRVSGLWRAQSVGHKYEVSDDRVSYTNEVVVRPTRDILIIGQGTIGDTLIGPTQ